ncbi:putative Alpha carbonic anhydrase 1 [Tripterygium wilfordii]|uniref:Carbonic anhydrase n=1 Tax=Tripterygium wilfordii TaxID=458696 RepID=A0A7J7CTJ5_TRIWF|nr:putative Alpha carbonic anhydrase 1 [Tripterygium wilfordii]
MASPFSVSVLAIALLLGVASAYDLESLESIKFGYTGAEGPDSWGSLSPHFSACSSGKLQSPVNILKNETVSNRNLKPLTRAYKPANATLVNNGFNIGIHYEQNVGVLLVDGKNYTLKQMHWHCPSEHQINGEQFAAELHLVHQDNDGNFAVVGILYSYGNADPFVSKVRTISKEQVEALEAPLDSVCKKNARPPQQLNGRNIELYDETGDD